MNRAEKKAKAKAAKRAAKLAAYRRSGGAPIPVVYPGSTFEQARERYNAEVADE